MIVAAWLATERRATNHGTPSLGTIEAGKERSAGERKAWPTPKARTKRKIGVVDNPWGRWTYQARARATMASDIEGRDPPPVKAVGSGAGDEHEQRRRRELGQPEEPEIELAAGQSVDQQAQHGGLGHVGHRRGQRRAQ